MSFKIKQGIIFLRFSLLCSCLCSIYNEFVQRFNKFNGWWGNDVFQKLSQSVNGIYTDYAKRNFQEFWAESVEIFFERPFEMKNTYLLLYESISDLLKQDPANKVT